MPKLKWSKGTYYIMDNKIKDKLKKEDILTIPNLLSFFRIILIPVMVILYAYDYYYAAVLIIFLSGLTDIADGKIARKYNMVSDFGKFIDPVADKLTQAAMILCLISKYAGMLALIILMFLKECFLFLCSYITFKKTGIVSAAKWYGKATTAILYAVMILLFLIPNIPLTLARILIWICGIVIAASLILYTRLFYQTMKANYVANS